MNKQVKAIHDFLTGLGCDLKGDLKNTPTRVVDLWENYLLAGHRVDVKKLLSKRIKNKASDPIVVRDIAVHLVCPHHLTVAFGTAHVGYVPNHYLLGFGVLSQLVQACTAQLILQEQATAHIADALMEHLQAQSAFAMITAVHPCHNVPHAKAHKSQIKTVAKRGHKKGADKLEKMVI